MRHQLMAEEIEIDPVVGSAPPRAAEEISIERLSSLEIVDRYRQMERRHGGHLLFP